MNQNAQNEREGKTNYRIDREKEIERNRIYECHKIVHIKTETYQ